PRAPRSAPVEACRHSFGTAGGQRHAARRARRAASGRGGPPPGAGPAPASGEPSRRQRRTLPTLSGRRAIWPGSRGRAHAAAPATAPPPNGALGPPKPPKRAPAIQVDRLLEGFGIGPAGKPLERQDVDVERSAIQRHGVLVEAQARRYEGKPRAKDKQHLAEI